MTQESKMMLVDKYRPTTVDDMVMDANLKAQIKSQLDKGKLNNLLLCGPAGIGKTTLARAIVNTLGADCQYVSCSMTGNVDHIRANVNNFCSAVSQNGLKVVILDEADGLSRGSNGAGAQDALRGLIEENQDDTRFILTCNYINKIEQALQSRCIPINIKFSPNDVMSRIIHIVKSEGIQTTKEDLKLFYTEVVKKKFPAIRDVIHKLELCTVDGVLKPELFNKVDSSSALDTFVEEFLALLKEKKFKQLRQFYMESDCFNNDYDLLARVLFNKFMDYPDKQIIISDHLFQMSFVLDKEINFYSMLLEIS